MPFDPAAARFGGFGGEGTTEAGSGSLLPTQKRDDWAEERSAVYEEMVGKFCEKNDDDEEGMQRKDGSFGAHKHGSPVLDI